jgi:hypothetical protein
MKLPRADPGRADQAAHQLPQVALTEPATAAGRALGAAAEAVAGSRSPSPGMARMVEW